MDFVAGSRHSGDKAAQSPHREAFDHHGHSLKVLFSIGLQKAGTCIANTSLKPAR
jgi:hypothetical protein